MSGTDERGLDEECVDRSVDDKGTDVEEEFDGVLESRVTGVGVEAEIEAEAVGREVDVEVVDTVEDGLVTAGRVVGENVCAEESVWEFACSGFLSEMRSCSGLSNCYL